MKEFNSSYSEILDMELETLLDLICVYDKINDADSGKSEKRGKIKYKVLD